MELIAINKAAEVVRISRDKCKYWCGLLETPIIKQGRVNFINAEAVSMLKAMHLAVSGGLSPAAASAEVKAVHVMPSELQPDTSKVENKQLLERIECLEAAVMLLVENSKQIQLQNQALLELVHAKNKKLSKPEPSELPDSESVRGEALVPHNEITWYRRLWLELFSPEQLRSNSCV